MGILGVMGLMVVAIVAILLNRLSGKTAVRVLARPLLTQQERQVLVLIERAVPHARVYVQVAMGALLRAPAAQRSESGSARDDDAPVGAEVRGGGHGQAASRICSSDPSAPARPVARSRKPAAASALVAAVITARLSRFSTRNHEPM